LPGQLTILASGPDRVRDDLRHHLITGFMQLGRDDACPSCWPPRARRTKI